MPSETFFRLKQEKREKINMVCLNEFYDQHISQVKVADIVEKAGISRGAFYKYFHDLEDAYVYMVKEYSTQIHKDIVFFLNKNTDDFFYGLEQFLDWCSHSSPTDSYWKKLKLCTQSNLLSKMKRDPQAKNSPMIVKCLELLENSPFTFSTSDEAVSFLYFIMGLVMDAITDFIANEWTSDELIQDFHYRVQWIQYGVKKRKASLK